MAVDSENAEFGSLPCAQMLDRSPYEGFGCSLSEGALLVCCGGPADCSFANGLVFHTFLWHGILLTGWFHLYEAIV